MISTPSIPIIYSIYSITNKINSKRYIGFTSKNPPEKRFQEHCKSTNTTISNAIKKHGKENFKFEVILQGWDRDHVLSMETYFIKEYNTFGKSGYNLTMGGEGAIGVNLSIETKYKMSIGKMGLKNPMYGKKPKNYNTKQSDYEVLQKSKTYIIVFPNSEERIIINLSEFCRKNNLMVSHMCNCAKGKRKYHKGFTCRYF